MATKRTDELKRGAASYFAPGDTGAAAEPAPKRKATAPTPAGDPVILATDKSRTPGGLLRRTLYFTPAEWGAVLAAAEAETRETGKLVSAAEIVRRAVWAYLVQDLDA